jgi:hypothetical protein
VSGVRGACSLIVLQPDNKLADVDSAEKLDLIFKQADDEEQRWTILYDRHGVRPPGAVIEGAEELGAVIHEVAALPSE